MKQFIGVCVLSIVGFSVVAAENNFGLSVGADAQWRFAPLKQGAGDNIVKKSYPQGAVYGGMKLNDTFGLEVGYQRSVVKQSTKTFTNSFSYFSSTAGLLATQSYISRAKVSMQGFYVGALGFLPISEEYRLKLIGSVGVVRMRAKIVSALDLVTGTTTTINDQAFHFTQSKWVPKLGVGLQHMFDDNIGLRAMAGWEQTSKFKRIRGINANTGAPSSSLFASLKDSTTLGLGMFYNF